MESRSSKAQISNWNRFWLFKQQFPALRLSRFPHSLAFFNQTTLAVPFICHFLFSFHLLHGGTNCPLWGLQREMLQVPPPKHNGSYPTASPVPILQKLSGWSFPKKPPWQGPSEEDRGSLALSQRNDTEQELRRGRDFPPLNMAVEWVGQKPRSRKTEQ